MDSVCYAKKKNGELCNTKLTEKNRNKIKIENRIYFVCGRHKKANNIDEIDASKYYIVDKPDTFNDKNDIIDDFKEKLNISENNREKDNKRIEKIDNKDRKKPCLQHIIYLISKDDNDICQFDDCQFAHNINIVYVDE